MSIESQYEDIPDALKKYIDKADYAHYSMKPSMRDVLKNSGLGETHRLIGAAERYALDSAGIVPIIDVQYLSRTKAEWGPPYGTIDSADVYRCAIYAPEYDRRTCYKREHPPLIPAVVDKLGLAEIGSKFRLLTPEEILSAEYGRYGRFRLKLGVIEYITNPAKAEWGPVDTNLGCGNMYNYYRVPIDLPFLMNTGLPADKDDEIPEDVLRFSFFIPSG